MSRKEHALINILESIAAEEAALAKIVHAEAEKVRLFVETVPHLHPKATVDNFIEFNTVVNRLLLTVLTKELVLLNKLDVAADLLTSGQQPEPQLPLEQEEHPFFGGHDGEHEHEHEGEEEDEGHPFR